MAEIGVRELKQHISEIMRRVREKKESFDITYRGRVVAWLVPVEAPEKKEDWRTVWAEMDETAAEIAKRLPPGVSAANLVSEQRR
ncbi:MAG: type II toxin-antitoxin system prevent-host-death family antitoxin [Dehalococcoidia bacterium]|nr:type II toxin-antitoxin system prevent-host-death family antitoxin [Dehalococcoidia bacterium]